MIYATRPFEYIHLDFFELPDAANGMKYVLCVTCDYSLTTLLYPTKSTDAATVVRALLDGWLSHYPDPDLIHTDGGTHFDNQVMEMLSSIRGWDHTICTPYAKWAHGVAERNNRTAIDIMKQLCRQLNVEQNEWPSLLKIVQGAMNRRRRASRGNRSPIELTTGRQPKTMAAMLHTEGHNLDVLDEKATRSVDEACARFADHMEKIYDVANLARREKSERNRRNTSSAAIPNISIGDFVLYAKHDGSDTKLDYTWLGPAEVVKAVSPLIYTIRPYTLYQSNTFDVHIKHLRRFASKDLHVTEELQLDIDWDHPDNIILKLVGHKVHGDEMHFKVRWKGFTTEMDSWKPASSLYHKYPTLITKYYSNNPNKRDDALEEYMAEKFPSLEEEEAERRRRRTPGDVAEVQLRGRGRHGRPLPVNTPTTRATGPPTRTRRAPTTTPTRAPTTQRRRRGRPPAGTRARSTTESRVQRGPGRPPSNPTYTQRARAHTQQDRNTQREQRRLRREQRAHAHDTEGEQLHGHTATVAT